MSEARGTYSTHRFDVLLAGLERMAGGDLDETLPISPEQDQLDAIAYGINVLVGELKWAHAVARGAEAKRMEALRAAKELAERASHEKTDFLRTLSHELRTPLSTILITCELLQSRDLPPPRRGELLDAINRNGRTLLGLIQCVLDLSAIEAGKLSVDARPIFPEDLIAEAVRGLEPQAMAKGVSLTSSTTSPRRPLTTDPRHFRQILVNLIANAVKFTERGKVRVTLSRPSAEGIVVDVADTGIGIGIEQRARLFLPFSQADPSIASRFGGTGLGLALARRLARALGGDLVLADSQPDHGSTFRLTLDETPAAATPDEPRNAQGRCPEIVGKQVLLAEDNEDLRETLRDLLQLHGARVTSVADGEDAVKQATARPFDFVLMDMRMPFMDGITATRSLRAQGYAGVIIALTAEALSDDEGRCLEAGCNGYVTKPIMVSKLIAYMLSLTRAVDKRDVTGGRMIPEQRLS